LENPAWTQKVTNALVRAENYASTHKAEVAAIISRDGKGYLPMPAKVIERAMTLYAANSTYLKDGAIEHPGWHDQRIDFKPYPYASAMTLIVNWLKTTKVAGNADFLAKLDADFVQKDLVDQRFVTAALAKYPPSTGREATTRTEVTAI
jgi:NitT/TauT family transport system substrate-binding protein